MNTRTTRTTVPARRGEKGFTLIELLVVIVIIGILAAIALPNLIRMRENAKMASCIMNQRNIFQGAFFYAMINNPADGVMNVEDLRASGNVSMALCECPSSDVADFDDYTIEWVNGEPADIVCTVEGDDHDWAP